MMTDTALAAPVGRPLPLPQQMLLPEPEPETSAGRLALWEGWQGDLRFFLTAYLAGFVFFLAVLS
jgi:hypothetical protein